MTAGTTIEQQLQAHGIHPTAARILVLQKLSELTHPVRGRQRIHKIRDMPL